MFDLFRSREKSVRILLGALLVVVAISMLTYLVPNYNSGAPTSDTVVASVGSDQITSGDVARRVQNEVRGRQLPKELVSTYIPQIVDQMVNEQALAYEATSLGFQVSDADLRSAIQTIIPDLFPDGHFVGTDAYAGFLARQEMSIQDFEAKLRRQLLVTKLLEVAAEGTIVAPVEVEHAYQERNEKIKIQFARVCPTSFAPKLTLARRTWRSSSR
jgi:peptidyl-prolyl cis-trans isomerase D